MIFSTRRKARREQGTPGDPPVIFVKTNDADFSSKIGMLLSQWQYCVHPLSSDRDGDEVGGIDGDVFLFDIRGMADEVFGLVSAIRRKQLGIEVVLINRPDNVIASIAGMRAGAGDELILPFDTGTLRTAVSEACKRSQAARDKRAKKSLFATFSEVMMAATFAQAGDFDGALDLLDSQPPPIIDKQSADKERG